MNSVEVQRAVRKLDAMREKASSLLFSIERLEKEVQSGIWGDDVTLTDLHDAYEHGRKVHNKIIDLLFHTQLKQVR